MHPEPTTQGSYQVNEAYEYNDVKVTLLDYQKTQGNRLFNAYCDGFSINEDYSAMEPQAHPYFMELLILSENLKALYAINLIRCGRNLK